MALAPHRKCRCHKVHRIVVVLEDGNARPLVLQKNSFAKN